jgi:hypothetical protein
VTGEENACDAAESRARGAYLRDDVGERAIVTEHPLDARHLAGDSLEACSQFALLACIHVISIRLFWRYEGLGIPTRSKSRAALGSAASMTMARNRCASDHSMRRICANQPVADAVTRGSTSPRWPG